MGVHTEKYFFESCWIKPNLDFNYTSLIYFTLNGTPFGAKLNRISLITIQIRFEVTRFKNDSSACVCGSSYLFLIFHLNFMESVSLYYELAKWTKFLLAVIYGSPRRHSNSSKTVKKNGKNLNTFLWIWYLVQINQNISYFKLKKIYLYKNQFLGGKWKKNLGFIFAVFFHYFQSLAIL